MSHPSNNDNQRKDDGDTGKSSSSSSSSSPSSSSFSSWFNSWFENDVRDEIHEKLNEFDDWKEEQEKRQKEFERRMMMSSQNQHQHPFFRGHPFFFPPPSDPSSSSSSSSSSPSKTAAISEERGSSQSDDDDDHHRADDIDRDMQSLLEAIAKGVHFPSSNSNNNKSSRNNNSLEDFFSDIMNIDFDQNQNPFGNNSGHTNNNTGTNAPWSNSSTTTTVFSSSSLSSSLNGAATSYRMHQDSRNGTQIDIQFPRRTNNGNHATRNGDNNDEYDISVEVLQERPCVIQWRNNNNNAADDDNDDDEQKRKMMFRRGFGIPRDDVDSSKNNNKNRVIQLGDAIDCAKLSASISEVENTLTLKAPIRKQLPSDNNNNEPLQQDVATASKPRTVPVVMK